MQKAPDSRSSDMRNPLWFSLAMALRWPIATVFATAIIAVTAVEILKNPIPIRVDGGVLVEKIALPIGVSAQSPLPVSAMVELTDSVQVQANQALPINGDVKVEKIVGLVDVGSIQSPIEVDSIKKPVDVEKITVESIQSPVSVSDEKPLKVTGNVKVEGSVQAGVNPLKSLVGK